MMFDVYGSTQPHGERAAFLVPARACDTGASRWPASSAELRPAAPPRCRPPSKSSESSESEDVAAASASASEDHDDEDIDGEAGADSESLDVCFDSDSLDEADVCLASDSLADACSLLLLLLLLLLRSVR